MGDPVTTGGVTFVGGSPPFLSGVPMSAEALTLLAATAASAARIATRRKLTLGILTEEDVGSARQPLNRHRPPE